MPRGPSRKGQAVKETPFRDASGKWYEGIMTPQAPKQRTSHQRALALEELRTAIGRRELPVPHQELQLLSAVALGDTGQSRSCRHLLLLLVGCPDERHFPGDGLRELRALDRELADAFLTVLNWWRGPVRSDEPATAVLRKILSVYQEKPASVGLDRRVR